MKKLIKEISYPKTAIIEATKEIGRVFLFAGISAVLTFLLGKLTTLPQTEFVLVGTIILRWIDKYLHEMDKVTPHITTIKGIAPF